MNSLHLHSSFQELLILGTVDNQTISELQKKGYRVTTVGQCSAADNSIELGWAFIPNLYTYFWHAGPKGVSLYDPSILDPSLKEQIFSIQKEVELSWREYSDFGAGPFRNLLSLLSYDRLALLSQLTHRFKNIPAIICGAGKSIEEFVRAYPYIQNKALIIAAGSSLPYLLKKEIVPDITVQIDPITSFPLETLNTDIPLFTMGRVDYRLIELWKGSCIHVGSTGTFPLEEYILKENGLQTKIDAGWMSPNVALHVATKLGCSPCIFSGVDLIYTEEETLSCQRNRSEQWEKIENGYTKREFLYGLKEIIQYRNSHSLYVLGSFPTLLPFDRIDCKSLLHYAQFPIDKTLSLQNVFVDCSKIKEEFRVVEKRLEGAFQSSASEVYIALCDIQDSFLYDHLLLPLWKIFQHPLKLSSENPTHKLSFFLLVIRKYLDTF